jgi:hypothetical protein
VACTHASSFVVWLTISKLHTTCLWHAQVIQNDLNQSKQGSFIVERFLSFIFYHFNSFFSLFFLNFFSTVVLSNLLVSTKYSAY